MAITIRNPHTIMLSGESTYSLISHHDGAATIGLRASATLTPGMLVEFHRVSGEMKVRANSSETEMTACLVLVDKPWETNNTGIDDTVAADEDCAIAAIHVGAVFYGRVSNAQTVNAATLLRSEGDGNLKTGAPTTAAGGVAKFMSLDDLGTTTAVTRCRVMRIA